MNEARIDKWLWSARIFKTRTIAADACKNGRVMVNGVNVKPARMVKVGDVISVRKPPVTYSFKILKTIEQRVGAKLLPEIYENVTPQDQYELLEMSRISGFVDRARGTGRPTKKDRRAMDAFVMPLWFLTEYLSKLNHKLYFLVSISGNYNILPDMCIQTCPV